MKAMTQSAIRAAMIRSGAIAPDRGRPEPVARPRVHPQVSKLNAILERRKGFAHS